MVNYTTWLKNEFDTLDNASSSETFKYIEQARKDCSILVFFVKVVLLFGSFTTFRYLGSVIEIELYTGLQGWALALFASFAASIISGPIEVLIMKKCLNKLVNVV